MMVTFQTLGQGYGVGRLSAFYCMIISLEQQGLRRSSETLGRGLSFSLSKIKTKCTNSRDKIPYMKN